MSKKNKKKKVLSKNDRSQRELEHLRQALEKRSAPPRVEELGMANMERGTLEFSEGIRDAKTVNFINEKGVSQIQSVDKVEVIHQDSKEWEAYLAGGGDPNITEGHVAVKLTTKDENEPNGNKRNSHTPPRNNWIHSAQDKEMLPIIVNDIHPDSRNVMSAEKALAHLDVQETDSYRDSPGVLDTPRREKRFNQVQDRIKQAASVDPNEEILIKGIGEGRESVLSKSSISPGIDNKELNLVYDLVTDTTTRRIRFDQLNYPVWEGHDTHPTRNEGFITKPPFPNMYVQFDGFVNLPPITRKHYSPGSELFLSDDDEMLYDLTEPDEKLEEVPITREMSISIGAIAFSDEIQHILIRKNSNGTARTILPQEGKTWKITPPQGTDPKYDGYSSEKNDSIMLGYLRWFGLLMDSNHHGLARINQGAYFDMNTGAIWLPLTKITGGQSAEVIHAPDVFQVEKNRMSTHLIPAGSGIESSALSEDWDSNRKMNIFEDTAMKVGDIFMFMMNYMTSPRMQTEEVQGTRGDRRRAQKQGLPPPPPWTTISYKPPSSIKRNSEATGTGSKHSYMYDVRGHWKNQRHGPGGTLRKLIWIHPHYSGLDGATYVPRSRLVQEKEEND